MYSNKNFNYRIKEQRSLFLAAIFSLTIFVQFAQYASVATRNIAGGNIISFALDLNTEQDVGPFKYIKDSFLLLVSMAWPFLIKFQNPRQRRYVTAYFLWLVSFTAIGVLSAIIYSRPLFYIVAGLRWINLLNASFGLFLFFRNATFGKRDELLIARIILFFLVSQCIFLLIQLSSAGGVAILGSRRLTGIFGNAGTNGALGLGCALILMCLNNAPARYRLVGILLSLFIVLSAGGRAGTVMVGLTFLTTYHNYLKSRSDRNNFLTLRLAAIPFIAYLSLIGYDSMISAVNRGGIIETQLSEGGRIKNFIESTGEIMESEITSVLLGKGIGTGTNTVFSRYGSDAQESLVGRLVDNSFLTVFFQIGAIGSIIFWVGIISFYYSAGKIEKNKLEKGLPYWVIILVVAEHILAGSFFEFYYIVTLTFVAFALATTPRTPLLPALATVKYR